MEIFRAARYGDLETVRRLIETEGVPVNSTTKAGTSLLHVAVTYGQTEMVAYLVSKGADINKLNGRGYSPLMSAAETGEPGTVDYLLRMGADKTIQSAFGAYTAANIAHMAGYSEIRDSLQAAGVPLQLEKHPDLLRWTGSPDFDPTPNAYLVSGGHGCEDIDFTGRHVMKPGYTLVVLGKCGGVSLYDKKMNVILNLFTKTPLEKKTKENLDLLLQIKDTFEDFKSAFGISASMYTAGQKYPNLIFSPFFDNSEKEYALSSGIFKYPVKRRFHTSHPWTGKVEELDSIYEHSIYPTASTAKMIFTREGGNVEKFKKTFQVTIREIMDRFGPGTYLYTSCRYPSCPFEAGIEIEKAYAKDPEKYKSIYANVPAHYESVVTEFGISDTNKPLIEKIRLVRQLSEEQQAATRPTPSASAKNSANSSGNSLRKTGTSKASSGAGTSGGRRRKTRNRRRN